MPKQCSPQWSSLDVSYIFQMLQKREWRLCYDMQDTHPCLWIMIGQDRREIKRWDILYTFRYSTKRLRNAIKCSAFLIFPGIASCNRSSGSTGLVMKPSLSASPGASSCRPSTSFAYSSCSLAASVVLILELVVNAVDKLKVTYSSILSVSLPMLRVAESSMGLVRSILRDSMQTLSERLLAQSEQR